jgi:hypothetical protein
LERYRVTLRNSDAVVNAETSVPRVDFAAAELEPFAGSPVEIAVEQVGDLAVSRPAFLTVSLS